MSLLPFILIMICLLISCKNKVQAPGIADRIEGGNIHTTTRFEELPEDFRKFYIQFHEDSVFQMNSIFFPLEGLPQNADPDFIGNEKYFWSPDQWVIHRELVYENKDYQTEYLIVSDVLIEETVIDAKNNLRLIRRFAKTGNGWRLIYYAGMNRYKKTG